MDIALIIINIGLIFVIACVVPSTQFKFVEIKDKYFKRVKIKKFACFFRAIGDKSAKKDGLILALFIEHLVGYMLSVVLSILSLCLLVTQGFKALHLISTINIIMLLSHVVVFGILCVILMIISDRQKNKIIKTMTHSLTMEKTLQQFQNARPATIQASEKSKKFLEMFHCQVCPLLLSGKKISSIQCRKILNSYSNFLTQLNVEYLDETISSYYKNIFKIMKVFEEYYC